MLSNIPMVFAEPVLSVNTNIRSKAQFEIQAFVEWDVKQKNDYLIKEAIFPNIAGAQLLNQSEKSMSYAGPLGMRVSKKYTATYSSQINGEIDLGKVEVVYSDKVSPEDFRRISSKDVKIMIPKAKIHKGWVFTGAIGLFAVFVGLLYRAKAFRAVKSVKVMTSLDVARESLTESTQFIYEADPKGYYKALKKLLDQYEKNMLKENATSSEFSHLKLEVEKLREKTGYAGFRTHWDEDKKLHARIEQYFETEKNKRDTTEKESNREAR